MLNMVIDMTNNEVKKGVIAFFDLDHTLLDGANGSIYARLMVRRRMAEPRTLLWIVWYTLLYKLNRLPPEEVYRKVAEIMGRYPIMKLLAFLDEGYEKYIMPRLFAGGVEVIERHREQDHLNVITTAAGEYVAERVRVQLGADDIIATPMYVEDERMSTKMAKPSAYGEGKLELARRFATARDVDLSNCYFYSDSASDLPLLEAVGHPVLVNPQIKLSMEVKGRDWPVLKFKEHASFKSPARPQRVLSQEMDRCLQEYESQLLMRG